jgi:hypothetical protein
MGYVKNLAQNKILPQDSISAGYWKILSKVLDHRKKLGSQVLGRREDLATEFTE